MDQNRFSTRQFIISTILVVILTTAIFLFIKFPYYIKSPCQFSAQYVWSLIEVEPGKLLSRLNGNNPRQVRDFNLLQFDRPDFVKFSMSRLLKSGQFLDQGALIGTVSSTENRIRFDELQGQLDRAKAQLNMISTGEKDAIQEEALRELKYAKSAFELYKPTIERKKQLLQDNLISQDEWDRVEAEYRLLELNVSIAEAKLQTVQSGDKSEAIDVLNSEIASIENQLRSVETKLSAETIRTPITGVLLDSYQPGTLCSIAGIDTMIAQVPISQGHRQYVKPGMKFEVKIPALANQRLPGNIVSVGQNAQMINNKTMFVITGTISNSERKVLPGMTGYVKIYCDKIPLWMLIKRCMASSRIFR